MSESWIVNCLVWYCKSLFVDWLARQLVLHVFACIDSLGFCLLGCVSHAIGCTLVPILHFYVHVHSDSNQTRHLIG